MKNTEQVSQQQLNEQINDKLNQLWSGMNDRRKKLVRNMTPGYSRRTDQSQLNQSTSVNYTTQNQLLKMRQKLASQVSNGKHKDVQIQNLKKVIAQLTNDKKLLVFQLQQVYGQNNQNANSSLLNQSSIQNSKIQFNKNTANFQSLKKKKRNKNFSTIQQQNEKTRHQQIQNEQKQKPELIQNLQSLQKSRLVQLLRSTAQYREFIYYYDSHQLSYLKRLQEQHRKNCDRMASVRQKALWAPTQVLQQLRKLNKKQKMGISQAHMQQILSCVKGYYERNAEQKLKKQKQQYENKLKKQQRQAQYGIPYQLVQICKAKQRQLSKMAKRSKNNSFKS